MAVIISMLRGVNVGGHNKIKMEALRAVYESLGFRDAQTHIQSGNVVFTTGERNLVRLAAQIEDAIERGFGFRPTVILRTKSEMEAAIANNPFVKRSGIDASRLLVLFLASDPSPEARANALKIKAGPEEFRIHGRELYVYFPNGMARPKVSPALLEKTLKTPATGRNWNSVMKLLEIASGVEDMA